MTRWIKYLLVVIFAWYAARAFMVSVVLHDGFDSQATGNQIKIEKIRAARGVILDKKGKTIASNVEEGGEVVRYYPDGVPVASIVGYVGDEGGVVGIEKYYDERLRGIDGNWQIIEDAAGREISKKEIDVAVAGEVLKTNVDLDLQLFVYNVLNQRLLKTGKSSSVVVSRIDGRVEALVSLPSFDPNLFVKNGRRGAEGGTYTESKKVVADEERKPLFNRAVQGSFAPGSVFKMVTALAAISDGGVSKADLIDDDGEIVIGSYRYGNWLFDKYGRTEGQIDLKRAIARSNDIYFYRIGEKMGIDTLIKWAAKYGLGQKTGIDLPGETAGLLPTPLWQEKTKGERWFLGNTFHLSIGQGDLLTSPVQINRMTASLFSNKLCQLNLVNQGKCIDINANKTNLEAVWEGMRAACQPGGTATPFFEFKNEIYCKTGTAQHGGEKTLPHAWFTAVLPMGEKIEDWLVITTLVEDGGEGSQVAAPIAYEIVARALK